MAKTNRWVEFLNTDRVWNTVDRIYKSGFAHSTIINSSILIVLALIFPASRETKKIQLSLNFSTEAELREPDYEPFVELSAAQKEQPEIQSSVVHNDIIVNDDSRGSAENITVENLVLEENISQDDISNIINNVAILQTAIRVEPKTKAPRSTKRTKEPSGNALPNANALMTQGMGIGEIGAGSYGGGQGAGYGNGEIEKRLITYGAKTGDVQISLSWNTPDDLDLHVEVYPIGSRINWTKRVGLCGGILDIDMNAHAHMLNNSPIENIFWGFNRAPYGQYVVGVHHYYPWGGNRIVQGLVRVKLDSSVKTFPFTITYGEGIKKITTFTRVHPK
jgi:hypothetical protein